MDNTVTVTNDTVTVTDNIVTDYIKTIADSVIEYVLWEKNMGRVERIVFEKELERYGKVLIKEWIDLDRNAVKNYNKRIQKLLDSCK